MKYFIEQYKLMSWNFDDIEFVAFLKLKDFGGPLTGTFSTISVLF